MAIRKEDLFPYEINAEQYCFDNLLNQLVGGTKESSNVNQKTRTIQRNYKQAFDPEFDDLSRLHYLCIARKALTILEFGVGKSTLILADALSKNRRNEDKDKVKAIRRNDMYMLYSVDSSKKWIKTTQADIKNQKLLDKYVNISYSKVKMTEVGGRICTRYQRLPNCLPDIIYLDAPDQYSPIGKINGVSTAHPDRMPMSGDILAIEYFLQPGCLIVVDGRGANAAFLKDNFQRNWAYIYLEEYDQHFFELQETAIGKFNKAYLLYALGRQYFERI